VVVVFARLPDEPLRRRPDPELGFSRRRQRMVSGDEDQGARAVYDDDAARDRNSDVAAIDEAREVFRLEQVSSFDVRRHADADPSGPSFAQRSVDPAVHGESQVVRGRRHEHLAFGRPDPLSEELHDVVASVDDGEPGPAVRVGVR
jgi:hypothetical protein